MDFSKIEAGKMELENSSFNFRKLLEDTTDLFALKCQDKNIELTLSYASDVPQFVIGDSGRVIQIVVNLLSNAIKFTEKGTIKLNVNSDVSSLIKISVEDTGIGIPIDKQQLIFIHIPKNSGLSILRSMNLYGADHYPAFCCPGYRAIHQYYTPLPHSPDR